MPVKGKRDKKHFTFVIIPHHPNAQHINFQVKSAYLYAGLCSLMVMVVLLGASLTYSAKLSRQLLSYRSVMLSSEKQQAVLDEYLKETTEVKKALVALEEKDYALRKMLGLKARKDGYGLQDVRLSDKNRNMAEQLTSNIENTQRAIRKSSRSLDELKDRAGEIRKRFAYTPSIWPARGQIVSYFGWRTYPWVGMHTGLDISASYADPVIATANGTITWAGWRQGYGKTVIVEHGHGISTLYGHNSILLGKVGQEVKKGDVIAYAGATGLATGVHVHYEVRRYDQPVNPMAYLNLDVLSAGQVMR